MRVAILFLMLAVSSNEKVLLKAHYTQVEGTDVEYGQGAIERNDLPHREIVRNTWLIQVPSPADAPDWQRKLNAAVDPKHGSFRVTHASAEEQRKVDAGEITLQH